MSRRTILSLAFMTGLLLATAAPTFARVGFSDGHYETFDFTDIDKTVAAGLSLAGRSWNRPNDTVGLAGVVNGASNPLLEYLNAGGLGVLVGDGKLPNPGW